MALPRRIVVVRDNAAPDVKADSLTAILQRADPVFENTLPSDTTKRTPRSRQVATRPSNLSLSADVLDATKALQINVSQVCDHYLRDVVRREQESRWHTEHANFIEAYHASFETEGPPLAQWSTF